MGAGRRSRLTAWVLGNEAFGVESLEFNMEATIVYWDYIGILEKKMEATIVYWDYVGFTVSRFIDLIFSSVRVYSRAGPWGLRGFGLRQGSA